MQLICRGSQRSPLIYTPFLHLILAIKSRLELFLRLVDEVIGRQLHFVQTFNIEDGLIIGLNSSCRIGLHYASRFQVIRLIINWCLWDARCLVIDQYHRVILLSFAGVTWVSCTLVVVVVQNGNHRLIWLLNLVVTFIMVWSTSCTRWFCDVSLHNIATCTIPSLNNNGRLFGWCFLNSCDLFNVWQNFDTGLRSEIAICHIIVILARVTLRRLIPSKNLRSLTRLL